MKENGQKRAGGQGGKRPRQAARPQAGPRRQRERGQEGNVAANGLPQCPVARQCGACQHVNQPYDQQLAAKDERVAQLFSQVAGPEALRPILGMQDPYAYRNKVMSPARRARPRPASAAAASAPAALPPRSATSCAACTPPAHTASSTRGSA